MFTTILTAAALANTHAVTLHQVQFDGRTITYEASTDKRGRPVYTGTIEDGRRFRFVEREDGTVIGTVGDHPVRFRRKTD